MQMVSLLYFVDIDVTWIPLLAKRLAKWRHLQQSKSNPPCKRTDTHIFEETAAPSWSKNSNTPFVLSIFYEICDIKNRISFIFRELFITSRQKPPFSPARFKLHSKALSWTEIKHMIQTLKKYSLQACIRWFITVGLVHYTHINFESHKYLSKAVHFQSIALKIFILKNKLHLIHLSFKYFPIVQ